MTIRDFLDNSASLYGGCAAQRFFQGHELTARTYAELKAKVIRLAYAIHTLGAEPLTDNVALMLPNSPEWEIVYLAIVACGQTAVPMDPHLRPREALHILKDSQAKILFTTSKHKEIIDEIKNDITTLQRIIYIDTDDFTSLFQVQDQDALTWYNQHKPTLNTTASILYTSGTTGAPKGACLTHANFEANADFAKNIMSFTEDDDFLVILPLFHAFSFTFCFLVPLYCGATSSFVRSLKTISDDMRAIAPTTILAVPLLAEKMYAKIDANLKKSRIARILLTLGITAPITKKVREAFGGRLRIMAIGGAPTDRKVLRAFKRFSIPAVEGYGMTECAPLVTFAPPREFEIGTVGKLLPCMQCKICDKDETGAGELRLKGTNVMKGYFHNEEATRDAFDSDGFFKTGDVVRQDAKGNISICGRCKAMIVNREGKNIYPEEIEDVISRIPGIHSILALGYNVKGEVGEHVGIIFRPDYDQKGELSETDFEQTLITKIKETATTNLAEYKRPRKIVIRKEEFELTSTMKIRRVVYKHTLDE